MTFTPCELSAAGDGAATWTVVIIAALSGSGLLAVGLNHLFKWRASRARTYDRAADRRGAAEQSESLWLREQIELMGEKIERLDATYAQRLVDLEASYAGKIAVLEQKYENSRAERQKLSDEAVALRLQNLLQQREMDALTQRVAELTRHEIETSAKLAEAMSRLSAQEGRNGVEHP